MLPLATANFDPWEVAVFHAVFIFCVYQLHKLWKWCLEFPILLTEVGTIRLCSLQFLQHISCMKCGVITGNWEIDAHGANLVFVCCQWWRCRRRWRRRRRRRSGWILSCCLAGGNLSRLSHLSVTHQRWESCFVIMITHTPLPSQILLASSQYFALLQ